MQIRELRKQQRLSQEELAERIGCHANTIRKWELGQREPRSSDIRKLCETLNCTEAELLNKPSKKIFKFKVKILMGIESLTGFTGIEITDNSFTYGIDDTKPMITFSGKIRIDTPEDRINAFTEMATKFFEACYMYDHKGNAEKAVQDTVQSAIQKIIQNVQG